MCSLKMKVLGVIPARFGSTRFPGKALAKLGNKSIIQWVYENARRVRYLDKVIIATDDGRIYREAKRFKADARMTSSKHKSGTERVAEVARKTKADIIVNIQGDEPFLKASMINRLVKEFGKDKNCQTATLATKIKNADDLNDPNVVKVVFDKNNYALYFSRSKIPYDRTLTANLVLPAGRRKPPLDFARGRITAYYKHLGIYAYKRSALLDFVKLPQSDLEKIECLEQLRALENGFKIRVIQVKQDTIGIDTPQDLVKAEKYIKCYLKK